MSFLRRRSLLRRFFATMERVASNLGLIREAGKEFRLFSHEEVTLVRQLAESRQRLLDIHELRAEGTRAMHSAVAREVAEAIQDVQTRQQALMQRQEALLKLCRQLLVEQQPLEGSPGCGNGSASAAATHATGASAAAGGAHSWHSSGLSGNWESAKQEHESGGQQQRHAEMRPWQPAHDPP